MELQQENGNQRLLVALLALGLTKSNQELADAYLDFSKEEQPELLLKAEKQNLSKLTEDRQLKSRQYINDCQSRNQTEELKRYVKLLFAIGKSTSVFSLTNSQQLFHVGMEWLREILTIPQISALFAEGVAWGLTKMEKSLFDELLTMGRENPVVLKEAMLYCQNDYLNAKIFLASLYFYIIGPKKEAGNSILKSISKLFVKEKEEDPDLEIREFLEESMIGSMKGLFSGGITIEDSQALQQFLRTHIAQEAVPETIVVIVGRYKKVSEYVIHFLTGCAFMALDQSSVFPTFIKICALVNPKGTLDTCLQMVESSYFDHHEAYLEQFYPISKKDYILWCVKADRWNSLERLSKECSGEYGQAMESATPAECRILAQQLAKGKGSISNTSNSKQISSSLQNKVIDELTNRFTVGIDTAKKYLRGEGSLETIYTNLNAYKDCGNEYWNNQDLLEDYKSVEGENGCYRRSLALLALTRKGYFYATLLLSKADVSAYQAATMLPVFQILREEGLGTGNQLELAAVVYEAIYQEEAKRNFLEEMTKVLLHQKEIEGEETFKRILFTYLRDNTKAIREFLVSIVSSQKHWEGEIRHMLTSKKVQERELAIQVMKEWGTIPYLDVLRTALKVEKSKKLIQILTQMIEYVPVEEVSETGVRGMDLSNDLVAELHAGGKKRKIQWACQEATTVVHRKDGSEATERYLQALMLCYAEMEELGESSDAKKLSEVLDDAELAQYVNDLYHRWVESGAETKKRWVLYLTAIHGGDSAILTLLKQITEWGENSRGSLGAEAVKALAFSPAPATGLLLECIAGMCRFKQIRTAALDVLK